MSNAHSPIRVLVVGGKSRAATAFRRHATTLPDIQVTTLVRSATNALPNETVFEVEDYFAPPPAQLQWANVLVNCAGLSHGRSYDRLSRVNVEGPVRLALRARDFGVAHFVQLSSLHVYGVAEDIARDTAERPLTPYGRSKLAADLALRQHARKDFLVTLLRLPVLYGGDSGENLRRLALLMARLRRFPVLRPLGRRSLLHVGNLAVALVHIIRHRPRRYSIRR